MGVIVGLDVMPDSQVIGLRVDAVFRRRRDWLSDLSQVVAEALPDAIVTESSDPQWDAFLRIDRVTVGVPTNVAAFNAALAKAAVTAFTALTTA